MLDFRKDVSKTVCSMFSIDDFRDGNAQYGDAEVSVHNIEGGVRVEIMVTRLMQFKRALIVESQPTECSAMVESYYL